MIVNDLRRERGSTKSSIESEHSQSLGHISSLERVAKRIAQFEHELQMKVRNPPVVNQVPIDKQMNVSVEGTQVSARH